MRTYKRKMKRGAMPEEKHLETAKEDLDESFSLRKSSANMSVSFMTIYSFYRRTEDGC
jgi:hypothetical protein